MDIDIEQRVGLRDRLKEVQLNNHSHTDHWHVDSCRRTIQVDRNKRLNYH